jgi:hypothetical protein
MARSTWGVVVAILFNIVTWWLLPSERWRAVLGPVALIAFVLACIGWLLAHSKTLRQLRFGKRGTHPLILILIAALGAVIFVGGWLLYPKFFLSEEKAQPVIQSYVEITKLRLAPDKLKPFLEVSVKNGGAVPADSYMVFSKSAFRSDPPVPEVVDALFSEFITEFDAIPIEVIHWRPELGPSKGVLETFVVKDLVNVDLNDLLSGKKFMFFVGGIQYADAAGHHRKAFCYFLAPPNAKTFQRGVYKDVNEMAKFMWENWIQCQLSKAREWEKRVDGKSELP